MAIIVGSVRPTPMPGEDQPAEDVADVVGLQADRQRHPRHARREDRRSGGDHDAGTEPGDQAARDQEGEQRDHDRSRHDREPGRQRRPVPHVLGPQHPRQQHRAERDREQERHRRRAGERPHSEQRARRSADCGGARSGARTRSSRTSAPPRTATVRVLPQPHVPPSTSPSVSAPTPAVISSALQPSGHGIRMARHVGQQAPARDQRGHADRHVHEEHPPPARGDQDSADRWTERGGEPAGRRPGPHGAVAALGGKRGQDQPERRRGEQGGAGGLEHPEGDQHREAGRGGARRRRRHEHRHPDAGSRARGGTGRRGARTARAATRRRSRSRSAPTRGRPAAADAEAARHLRERDVDDEQVEARQHDAGAHDHENHVGGGVGPADSRTAGPAETKLT